MAWIIFENSDEATKIFFSFVTVFFVSFMLLGGLYFWIKDKFRK